MKARIWLNELCFSDGTKIQLEKNAIIVFVGPNNVGKSVSLKEMLSYINASYFSGKVIKSIGIEKEGTEEDLIARLKANSIIDNSKEEPIYSGLGYSFYESVARSRWNKFKTGIGSVTPLFCNLLSTENRLQAANPAENIQLTKSAFSHPIHFLQKYDNLEQKICDYFRQAFGTDLIVHRNSGNTVPLYVGKKPTIKAGEDRVSEGYLKDLESLELLQEQGDGMRSFVGLILNAFISDYSMLFIDEPEAFLHPPQARLLGKMLAKDLPMDRQLFLATHSESFLKGLLDANSSNLKVIRIQRDNKIKKVNILNN